MITSLEHEKEARLIKNDIPFHEIGEKGSLIPMVVEDKYGIVREVLFCESVSGGQDESNHMPRRLSLTKLKIIDGQLHKFTANYFIEESDYLIHRGK